MSTEEKLRETISLLNAIIESTADGLLVVDREGKIVQFNQIFARMWNIPASVLESRDDEKAQECVLSQLCQPEKFIAKIKELYTSFEQESFDVLEFKDGRIFERLSRPQRLGDQIIGRVWSFRDVTERARLIRELEESVTQRDDFLSIASHELKTPLTSLTMHFQLLHRLASSGKLATLSEKDSAEIFRIANQQIARFTSLIDDLLDTSRITSIGLELNVAEVHLAALVQDIVNRFRPELERLACAVEIECDLSIRGSWDPNRIEQLVVNMLSNAMKYGPGKPILIHAERRAECARLSVRDHGIGISKEDQGRIFSRFERAVSSKRFGGLGLGLYICRQIAEAHRGTIAVESEPGQGAKFIVELPLTSA